MVLARIRAATLTLIWGQQRMASPKSARADGSAFLSHYTLQQNFGLQNFTAVRRFSEKERSLCCTLHARLPVSADTDIMTSDLATQLYPSADIQQQRACLNLESYQKVVAGVIWRKDARSAHNFCVIVQTCERSRASPLTDRLSVHVTLVRARCSLPTTCCEAPDA